MSEVKTWQLGDLVLESNKDTVSVYDELSGKKVQKDWNPVYAINSGYNEGWRCNVCSAWSYNAKEKDELEHSDKCPYATEYNLKRSDKIEFIDSQAIGKQLMQDIRDSLEGMKRNLEHGNLKA